jgi:ketosteroid isomerase-like protein
VSEDDLDVMRRCFDAWNSGDIATLVDQFHEHAELVTDPSWAEAGTFIGRAAIGRWLEGLRDSWEGHDEVLLRELFEVDDKVIARHDWNVRGRASGIETNLDATSISNIREGKIVRQQWYLDYATALKTVGLEP